MLEPAEADAAGTSTEDIEEQDTPYPCRVTKPRTHIRGPGTREVLVDRVFATGEHLETLKKAVKAWLRKDAPPYKSSQQIQKRGEKLRKYAPGERKMKDTDLRAACLVRHVLTGDSIGVLARKKFVVILTQDGRKHHVTLKGKPTARCPLCGDTHEPYDLVVGEKVHPGCMRNALREDERQESLSRAEKILKAAMKKQ